MFCSVVVSGVKEITVTVDVYESSPSGEPHAVQATQNNAAVTADDYRKSTFLKDVTHLLRQLQRKRTDRQTVTNSRSGLSVELILWSLERYDFLRVQCASQARIHQRLRRAPRTGLAASFPRSQSEIARREHDAGPAGLRLRRTRLPAGDHRCAGDYGELSARDVHGWFEAAANPCVILAVSIARKFFMVFVLFFVNL